jgi:diguanylate cyclase (GGDEF)-like protein
MSAAQHTHVRVLVADDEAAVRDSYRDILKPRNTPATGGLDEMRARLFGTRQPAADTQRFDLTLCGGAEEAVQAVHDANEDGQPFSVVFLDMRMPPGPDGVWAATRIRELDPRIDIVVVTAYSDIDPDEITQRVPPAGSLFYLQKPFHAHEVRQLAGALGRRREAEDRIRRLAYFDEITGLPNRALFIERMNQALGLARRNQRRMAVLFMDLDNFKRVNDTLGHSTGDLLLKEVAQRLRLDIRSSDTVTHGRLADGSEGLARFGGDEFTLFLPEINRDTDAGRVAQRVLEALSAPISLAGQAVTVTASIGIAVFPQDGQDEEALLKRADIAMYAAKREGRNGFRFFTEGMQAAAVRRMAMETHLGRALALGELSLHYQPQIDVASGAIAGAEALLRWDCAALGGVSPLEFIPLAEETGLILPIGEWVLRTACAQAKAWRDAGVPLPRVAVNVSVRQFAQDGFPALVERILREVGLEPSTLAIEITEGVLMKYGEAALATLRDLKALGVQLVIDDFGTGYSSLSILRRFPIDGLKIDRSFICIADCNGQDRAIAAAVIAIAGSMSLRVIAGGVETENQLSFLRSRHCNEAQGYLLSRPLPIEEAARFLRQAAPLGTIPAAATQPLSIETDDAASGGAPPPPGSTAASTRRGASDGQR